MGVGMDLEFDKYCKVDQSPRTVLKSSHHNSKTESKSRNSKSSSRKSQVSLEAGFKEIKFRNYHRSFSCKTLPSRNNELTIDREVLKRGSVYQSSNDRKSFKKPDGIGARKKIELSLNGDSPFSFSLLDSICGSDDNEDQEKPCSRKNTTSYRTAERDLIKDSKFKSYDVVGPSNSANVLKEDDDDDNQALSKSLSAKLALPHSPTRSHNKTKIKTLQKSLLHDFSSAIIDPFSPAHLHGDLKLEHRHGVSQFELSLSHSETILVAKKRKTEDALNWVYTFHSFPSRKKSNASGHGVKFSTKDSPIVGQMQVSCHLCGAFSSSMMTEFVLYDIINARKSFAAEDGFDPTNNEAPNAFEHPSNEIAAVTIQRSDSPSKARICVVTPLGNHGMPVTESRGPSTLLDRWRIGGGCDCGGWDMACPLNVFDNISITGSKENQPVALYVKGAKETSPGLAMKLAGKGKYSVEFHAKLSALQALGICVAVLHEFEASTVVEKEKKKHILQCSSMKVILEEKMTKASESFVLDPPFSPIARV